MCVCVTYDFFLEESTMASLNWVSWMLPLAWANARLLLHCSCGNPTVSSGCWRFTMLLYYIIIVRYSCFVSEHRVNYSHRLRPNLTILASVWSFEQLRQTERLQHRPHPTSVCGYENCWVNKTMLMVFSSVYLMLAQDVWSRSEWQNRRRKLITKVLIKVFFVMSAKIQYRQSNSTKCGILRYYNIKLLFGKTKLMIINHCPTHWHTPVCALL